MFQDSEELLERATIYLKNEGTGFKKEKLWEIPITELMDAQFVIET